MSLNNNNNNNNQISNKTLEHQYTHTSSQEQLLKERAHNIRLLILDVDGVMTDGSLYYEDTGLCMKRFNVLDGIGIRLAKEAGLSIAIVSGMDAPCVERRLKDLGISDYHPGINNKHAHIDKLRVQKNLQWNEIAYVGDDWVDLAPMTSVGLPIAVDNAVPEVKKLALYITKRKGGDGAIREVIDLLLIYQNKKEALLHTWMNLK